ncbi:MAG: TRAP transporter small permease subunit [Burkholderiaceae bacterium]
MTNKPELADESIASRRSDNIADLPADMPGWAKAIIVPIDWLNLWIGKLVGFLILPLIFAMTYEIFMRKAFTAPTAWAFDISRMLYGAMFILGAAYGLSKGIHIRSDFLYRNWSIKTQGRVDLFLYLVFFLPTMTVFLWVSTEWALKAVMGGERGMDSAWMPLLGPIKSSLPVGVLLLLLQGLSETVKSWYAATRGRWPNETYDPEADLAAKEA